MSELDRKVLEDFWSLHKTHNPGKTIEDYEVQWQEGYAYCYKVIDKETGERVLKVHADVVDPSGDPDLVRQEIANALRQIDNGDSDIMIDIDEGISHRNAHLFPENENVKKWLAEGNKFQYGAPVSGQPQVDIRELVKKFED